MKEVSYKYSNKPRGLFRALLALKRVLNDPNDLEANVEEAAIVEIYFNRSKFGRKVARWDLLAEEVKQESTLAAEAMLARRRLNPIDLDALSKMPVNSLGQVFASHAVARGIDPNLLEPIPADNDGDWLMGHAYETHDLWHLLTGHYFDMEGEYGVAGFYLGQMPKFSFIAFFVSVITLQHVWKKRDELGKMYAAFFAGYEMGRKAKCLVGLDWDSVYHRDIDELRREFNIDSADKFPELEPLAA